MIKGGILPYAHNFYLSTINSYILTLDYLSPLSTYKVPTAVHWVPTNGSFAIDAFAMWVGIYRY